MNSEISVSETLDDAALAPWVELADRLGVSRSLGQLYGLLFMANRPMSAQDCVEVLAISRSSAGQGLKVLKEFGAIKSDFKMGDRSERFVVEPDLGVFLTKVLDGRLMPAFVSFFAAMQSVRSVRGVTDLDRFRKLDRWEKKLGDALSNMKEGLL